MHAQRGEPRVSSSPSVEDLTNSVYVQPDGESEHAELDRILYALADELTNVVECLGTARTDILAFAKFPKDIWRQIRSDQPR